MANWLERARRQIAPGADRTTAKADERDAMAVMAVPRADECTVSPVSIGSNGSSPAAVSVKCVASSAWLMHFLERDPLEVHFAPAATHAEALAAYPAAVAAEPFGLEPLAPAAPLATGEEMTIREWLAEIGENDPAIIGEVSQHCRADGDARAYVLRRAAVEARPAAFNDDLRHCGQCANLTGRGLCLAARRGEIVASRTYEPIRDLLRRCEGYAPGPDDPDRRPGRERWPGLTPADANGAGGGAS